MNDRTLLEAGDGLVKEDGGDIMLERQVGGFRDDGFRLRETPQLLRGCHRLPMAR